jgi:hypothetical protein
VPILFVQYCILPGRLFTQTLGRVRMCVTNNVGCVLIMKIASYSSEREEVRRTKVLKTDTAAKVIQAAPNHFMCYLRALIFDNLLPTTSAVFYRALHLSRPDPFSLNFQFSCVAYWLFCFSRAQGNWKSFIRSLLTLHLWRFVGRLFAVICVAIWIECWI